MPTTTESYPKNWARVTLMVSPTGEMHAIAGDRAPGGQGMKKKKKKKKNRDPHAELRAALAAGKTIQFRIGDKWYGAPGSPDHWGFIHHPSMYRVKPDPEKTRPGPANASPGSPT